MKCVYKIINNVNNKYYVGSTKQYKKRINQHKSTLKRGKHANIKLQRAWDKYGEEAFTFFIIEECENYTEREDWYLSKADIQKETYNIAENSKGTWYLKNHPKKEEFIQKNIYSRKEYLDSLTKEERSKIYGRSGNNHHRYKGGITKPCSDCGKDTYYKGIRCRQCYIKNGTGNQKGVIQSQETIEKRSEKMTKLYSSGYAPVGKAVIIDNIEYKSIAEASRELPISYTTISNRLRSENFNNYTFKYKKDIKLNKYEFKNITQQS